MKADVVYDVAMTPTPNVLPTELHDLYTINVLTTCVIRYFMYPMGQIRVCKIRFVSTGEYHGKPCPVCKNIRILNDCEVRTENSVTRITVIASDRIFNSHRTTVIDSCSCIPFLR